MGRMAPEDDETLRQLVTRLGTNWVVREGGGIREWGGWHPRMTRH